jgi:hypothetical protein
MGELVDSDFEAALDMQMTAILRARRATPRAVTARLCEHLGNAASLSGRLGTPQRLVVGSNLKVMLDYGHTQVGALHRRLGLVLVANHGLLIDSADELHALRLEHKVPVLPEQLAELPLRAVQRIFGFTRQHPLAITLFVSSFAMTAWVLMSVVDARFGSQLGGWVWLLQGLMVTLLHGLWTWVRQMVSRQVRLHAVRRLIRDTVLPGWIEAKVSQIQTVQQLGGQRLTPPPRFRSPR